MCLGPVVADLGVAFDQDVVIKELACLWEARQGKGYVLVDDFVSYAGLPLIVDVPNLQDVLCQASSPHGLIRQDHCLLHETALVALQQIRDKVRRNER